MFPHLLKLSTRYFLLMLSFATVALSAQQHDISADEKRRDMEFDKLKADLESLRIENKRLDAELEKIHNAEKLTIKERIFVDLRGGGSLGLSNLAGSGFGYATGIELMLGAGFSANFRFANGSLSIASTDFNSRLQGEAAQLTGSGNISSVYFSFSTGASYYFLKSEGFSMGIGVLVIAKKLTSSLFEPPVYPAAAGELSVWYRILGGIDIGLSGRFEYAKISQFTANGASILLNSSKSSNEAGLMLAIRFLVL